MRSASSFDGHALRWRWMVLAAVGLLVPPGGAVLGDGPDEPDAPREGASFQGKIVLFGAKHPERETALIQTMHPDGTGRKTVAEFEDVSILPGRVSPDGRRVAFMVQPRGGGKVAVWVMPFDGRHEVVVEDAAVSAWAPDGKRIVCYRGDSPHRENFTVEVRTKETERLPVPGTDAVEDWSPDGTELLVMTHDREKFFEHPEKGRYPLRQIYRMKVDGSDRVALTTDPQLDNIFSRFSPDGRKVAHYCRRHENNKVVESGRVVDRTGENSRELVRFLEEFGGRLLYAPCWSPDGTYLIWPVLPWPKEGDHQLRLILTSVDGTDKRPLKLDQRGERWWGFPDWR